MSNSSLFLRTVCLFAWIIVIFIIGIGIIKSFSQQFEISIKKHYLKSANIVYQQRSLMEVMPCFSFSISTIVKLEPFKRRSVR